MMLKQLEKKIDFVLGQFVAKNGSRLPFKGYYTNALRTFLVNNLGIVGTQWERFNASGDVDAFIDWMINFAKASSMGLPFPASLMVSPMLEAMRVWLHANKGLFKDGIGATV